MSDKKTSVFGIYPNLTQAERAVDALIRGRFSNDDLSVLAPDQQGTKDFAHEKHTKAPEGATTGMAAGGALAERWVCSPALGRSRSPASGRSLRPVRSWARWQGSELAAPWVVSSVRWWAWESPSTKRSATRAESRTAAC